MTHFFSPAVFARVSCNMSRTVTHPSQPLTLIRIQLEVRRGRTPEAWPADDGRPSTRLSYLLLLVTLSCIYSVMPSRLQVAELCRRSVARMEGLAVKVSESETRGLINR